MPPVVSRKAGSTKPAGSRKPIWFELLHEAVAVTAGTDAPLEHMGALHDLGAAARRAGRRDLARESLLQALHLADRHDALRLAQDTRVELHALGRAPAGRPCADGTA